MYYSRDVLGKTVLFSVELVSLGLVTYALKFSMLLFVGVLIFCFQETEWIPESSADSR